MFKQRNVARPVWVVLDPHNGLLASHESMRVHKSYTTLVSSTTTPDCDVTRVVSTRGLFLSHRQLSDRATFVKVVVHWLLEMGGARL